MNKPTEQQARGASRLGGLTQRLERLEQQLGRLTELLTEQATARKRRRRQLTLRSLLVSFILFGLLFAWFGRVYHDSRRQAVAVDRLVSQSAYIHYEPRDSALVSMLPGDPQKPPRFLTKWLGDDFFLAVTNVSTSPSNQIQKDKKQIIAAVSSIPQLQRLRLTTLSLRTGDLQTLGNLTELHSLDLIRTGLDAGAMPWLPNTQLRWFNASHTHIGDRALYDLSRCRDLQHLELERTSISDAGLKHLYSMAQLRYLNLKRAPVSRAAVQQLSAAIPTCLIEWEPLRFLGNGQVNVAAARNGYMQLGQQVPLDPRMSRRPLPPIDQAPQILVPTQNGWMLPNSTRTYPGFTLDVF